MAKNPNAEKATLIQPGQIYSGEGELHGLMRALGLDVAKFCEIAGISGATFRGWCGHPMLRWPIRLLYHYYRAQMMEAYLKHHGVDVEQFEPPEFQRLKVGQYPRKQGDVDRAQLPRGDWSPWDRI